MKQRDQKKSRPPQPFKKKLHFPDGEVWSWRFGNHVAIRTPDNKKTYVVSLTEITGWSWDDLERAEWKGYWPEIGPQLIKDYITLHLRPHPDFHVPIRAYVHPHLLRPKRWHIFYDCPNLPHQGRICSVDPEIVTRGALAERMGTEPSAENCCHRCLYRFTKNPRRSGVGGQP